MSAWSNSALTWAKGWCRIVVMWFSELLEAVQPYSQAVFHLSPAVIAIVGFLVAVVKFNLFRARQPAINAVLSVYSRKCSESLVAVAAEAAVTNTSRVKVDIRHCTWVVNKIAPYQDIDVGAAWEECWRTNQEQFTLEPGETDTLSMRVRLDDQLEAIDVILILDQPRKLLRRQTRHWVYRYPHDLNRS